MILSSETLNEDPTGSNTQENVLQKPNIAQKSDIISKNFKNIHIESGKTNVNEKNDKKNEEKTTNNYRSEGEFKTDEFASNTETQLPQSVVQHIHEASGEAKSE